MPPARAASAPAVTKRRVAIAIARRVVSPLVTLAVALRLVRGWALLETRGRRTGLRRRTPVGNGLLDGTFWLVAAHGRGAGYVRNIEADPRVRVFVRGRWHSGTAVLLPEDDPLERQRSLPRLNALAVRLVGTDLLTIRIDLDL